MRAGVNARPYDGNGGAEKPHAPQLRTGGRTANANGPRSEDLSYMTGCWP